MEETIVRKTVPKIEKATEDSKTVKQIKMAETTMTGKKGISFYCSKRHEYISIENVKAQSIHPNPLYQTKRIILDDDVKKEIAPNIRTKQWQD